VFDLNKLNVSTVENLVSGGRYRVISEFIDARGERHPAGEEWTFREAQYRHDQRVLALSVEGKGGPSEIPLDLRRPEGNPGLGRLRKWFECIAAPVYAREPKPELERASAADVTAEPGFRGLPESPEWRVFEERLRLALRLAKEEQYGEASRIIHELVSGPDEGDGKIQTLAQRLSEAAASVAGKDDKLADWLQERSTSLWYAWASAATSGGEGTARVRQLKAMGIWNR
jgi:hypothetical protein